MPDEITCAAARLALLRLTPQQVAGALGDIGD
jgi:hypothetical protein